MVTARDITAAKREARDEHINDDGTSNADHIFAYVPELLGVDDWHRHGDGEDTFDKEHLWRRDDHNALVYMERSQMGWRVEGRGTLDHVREEFSFDGRKAAEAFLVELMK
jgi:hypothetical protein